MSSIADSATGRRPPLLRTVVAAQLALIVAFVLVAAVWLGRMAAAEVGPDEMQTGAYDPKDLVPFGMHGWNPFMWLYGITSLLYLGGLASPLLALYSAALLARERHELSRRSRVLLLVGIVGGVAVTVLRFIPAGADMQAWWLD
ncbi:hypothetical protein Q2K19_10055 [Micromonospora soli]|uniref:hypothetical protein n=1 Tax=Micromonospora sp. NBRC 110009 TaxID=3061627 RepID=UPI002673755C|nr:hypothetical protein [Micromonospora sp. NBRC 110009]WKU00784.1 hypothetical protein Q2K19_10055 [Micromonospora sp. NBRC 110009]